VALNFAGLFVDDPELGSQMVLYSRVTGFTAQLQAAIQEETGIGGGSIIGITRGPVGLSNPDPIFGTGGVRYQVNFSDEFGSVTNYSVNYKPATGEFGVIKPSSGPK